VALPEDAVDAVDNPFAALSRLRGA
jgi:hypothetical protein